MIAGACAGVSVIAVLAGAPQPARAQSGPDLGLTATFVSEYVARGMSLSEGRPAPQLRIDVDGRGWYAGALVSRVRYDGIRGHAQLLAYAGHAERLSSSLSWEAGALRSTFTGGRGYDRSYDYGELYAGLAGDRLAGRVYVSPSYYGDAATVYVELNATTPVRDGLALIGHLGLLQPLAHAEDEARRRLDLRVGMALDSGGWNLQLALLANMPRRQGAGAPRALQVSASYGF